MTDIPAIPAQERIVRVTEAYRAMYAAALVAAREARTVEPDTELAWSADALTAVFIALKVLSETLATQPTDGEPPPRLNLYSSRGDVTRDGVFLFDVFCGDNEVGIFHVEHYSAGTGEVNKGQVRIRELPLPRGDREVVFPVVTCLAAADAMSFLVSVVVSRLCTEKFGYLDASQLN